MWLCVEETGGGAGSTLAVGVRVSPKGRKVFTANSRHPSVSGRSARTGVYTGGNTIYLMLHCPHLPAPHPPTGDTQCLTSISYSAADRQAGGGLGEGGRGGGEERTPSCCKSPFKQSAGCNLKSQQEPLAPRRSPYLFLFILECAIDFAAPSNDVCKRRWKKRHAPVFGAALTTTGGG